MVKGEVWIDLDDGCVFSDRELVIRVYGEDALLCRFCSWTIIYIYMYAAE